MCAVLQVKDLSLGQKNCLLSLEVSQMSWVDTSRDNSWGTTLSNENSILSSSVDRKARAASNSYRSLSSSMGLVE